MSANPSKTSTVTSDDAVVQATRTSNAVFVLAVGYCRSSVNEPHKVHSNCTSTLIRSKSGKNIVVDTLTPWHRQQLVDALVQHGLTPADIHLLVCTHGHSDHVGNNNLFVQAERHIVGRDVNHADEYTLHDFDQQPLTLIDGIQVVATTGHTAQCVSITVPDCEVVGATGKQRVVIAGDLFERMEDIWDDSIWVEAGTQNEAAQRLNRCLMAGMADYVVPGHGPMFRLTDVMREKLRADALRAD